LRTLASVINRPLSEWAFMLFISVVRSLSFALLIIYDILNVYMKDV